MIGVGEMITMVTKTMIDIKEITIVANDVRKNSVIAVTGIIKDKQL
ncbi:hypothetical protein BN997_00692 [Oceanobacillus oncorhynchi]|uniref:Uncharacterized protein n=1 Tax=Oceanobacillus oncorhynchi TaxID=545501 RepID=A0A0A1MMI7_9BACI|nr:hypothetical protein [Oceanobacillus oncorhynchi]CEI80882.1 hypothetical protein BN997_00692 [Oceanobacillus oncorhynchi]